MDLSKHNLSATDETALSVASKLGAGITTNLILTNQTDWKIGKTDILQDFAPTFRIHEELIESLESNGYVVIDGSLAVLKAVVAQAAGVLINMKTGPGTRFAVLLYKAEWVQGTNTKAKTMIVDYHLFAMHQPQGVDQYENFNSISSAKLPLTRGVTLRDSLFDQFIQELTQEDSDGEEG